MAFTVTSSSRRLVMAVLLALAIAGAAIRLLADNPSTLRDMGTLLLVLWIPAVGNLIGWLRAKLPAATPPPTGFAEGAPFEAQLVAELTPLAPEGFLEAFDPATPTCTVLSGRQGFTARTVPPLAQWLADPAPHRLRLQFLAPALALRRLPPQTAFHVLVGQVAVAKGRVLEQLARTPPP
jgi:hypothetical protein